MQQHLQAVLVLTSKLPSLVDAELKASSSPQSLLIPKCSSVCNTNKYPTQQQQKKETSKPMPEQSIKPHHRTKTNILSSAATDC